MYKNSHKTRYFFPLQHFWIWEISRGFSSLLVGIGLRTTHIMGKALGEEMGLLCAPFTLSIPFTSLSLSPLYPCHLSIPFTYLSLSPIYPFHLSLSLLSLPPSLYLSFYLSFSLLHSLSGRFRPCFLEMIIVGVKQNAFFKKSRTSKKLSDKSILFSFLVLKALIDLTAHYFL